MPSARDAFYASSRYSLKVSSYFAIYDRLLRKYQDVGPVSLVEFGVLHGGSLHMWRHIFGPEARIIGIDLNPDAKRHEADGFEIFIIDQEDRAALTSVFERIGNVDIVIDDGAHTNPACVFSLLSASNYINPGGIHIVEDVHTSFNPSFGNPAETSVFALGVYLAELMSKEYGSSQGLRGEIPPLQSISKRLSSIEFFSSLMALHYRESSDPWERPIPLDNGRPQDPDVADLRNERVPLLGALSRIASLTENFKMPLEIEKRRPSLGTRDFLIKLSTRLRNRRMKRWLKRESLWWR